MCICVYVSRFVRVRLRVCVFSKLKIFHFFSVCNSQFTTDVFRGGIRQKQPSSRPRQAKIGGATRTEDLEVKKLSSAGTRRPLKNSAPVDNSALDALQTKLSEARRDLERGNGTSQLTRCAPSSDSDLVYVGYDASGVHRYFDVASGKISFASPRLIETLNDGLGRFVDDLCSGPIFLPIDPSPPSAVAPAPSGAASAKSSATAASVGSGAGGSGKSGGGVLN